MTALQENAGSARKRKSVGGAPAVMHLSPMGASPVAASIELIRARSRERLYAITQQSRADRSCEAFVAGALGYRGKDTEESDRARLFKTAAKLIAALEKGADTSFLGVDAALVTRLAPAILASAAGRRGFDELREAAEQDMAALAETLPAMAWVRGVPGLGPRGLAVIVGAAGDLGNYANPGKLWKRFGLAPYKGRAASTWRRRGGLSADDWTAVGFSPRRLGQLYGVVTVPVFMHKAKGVYGLVYAEAKARYDQRVIATAPLPMTDAEKWVPARADMAARRYMTKRLLRDLWSAWRAA